MLRTRCVDAYLFFIASDNDRINGITRIPVSLGMRLKLKDRISLKNDKLEQTGEVAERLKARPC